MGLSQLIFVRNCFLLLPTMSSFDIEDRKGLEIVILTALLTFQDSSDVYHGSREENSPSSPSTLPALGTRKTSEGAPLPPPKPAPKTGVDRIAEMQAMRREVNEVSVEDEGNVDDYAQYCANLLQVRKFEVAYASEYLCIYFCSG